TVAAGLGLAVLAALPRPDVAWGQASTTLDEVVVQGAPAAPRRPSVTPDRSSATTSARSAPTTPQPLSALSVVATTPATGIGFDRSKVPSLVQTLTTEDFTRARSASALGALQQRVPGVNLTDI